MSTKDPYLGSPSDPLRIRHYPKLRGYDPILKGHGEPNLHNPSSEWLPISPARVTVGGGNSAPPKNPWNDSIPQSISTNLVVSTMAAKWCEMDSVHSMGGRIPVLRRSGRCCCTPDQFFLHPKHQNGALASIGVLLGEIDGPDR